MTVRHGLFLVALAALRSSWGIFRFGEAAVLIKSDHELHRGELRADRVSRSGKNAPNEANVDDGHEKAIEEEKGSKEVARHDGEGEKDHHGFVTVLGFGAAVILFSLSFGMANHSNKKISLFTWRCIDNVISIFLAVLLFQALDEVVVSSGLLPKSHVVIGSFIYAVLLLALAVGMSTIMKRNEKEDEKGLAIFAASSGHFVGFAFMHATTIGMEHHSESLLHAFLIFIFVIIFIPALTYLLFHVKTRLDLYSDKELIEKIDDIENDAGAMAVSICWTMLVCFYITGMFQDLREEEDVDKHARKAMLIYCVLCTVVGSAIILFMCDSDKAKDEGQYVKHRATSFCSSVIAMTMAWAWLVWGKWCFHESAFAEYPMFSRIWFAFIVSIVAIAVILVLGMVSIRPQRQDRAVKLEKEELLLILTVSLVAGWSWEEAFDHSLETIAETGHHEEYWNGMYKLLAGAIMLAIVLPVHVIYFKPLALDREKVCGEAGLSD